MNNGSFLRASIEIIILEYVPHGASTLAIYIGNIRQFFFVLNSFGRKMLDRRRHKARSSSSCKLLHFVPGTIFLQLVHLYRRHDA